MSRIEQSTNAVLMIRPARFFPNPETAADNAFQQRSPNESSDLSVAAQAEFDRAVEALRSAGVRVHVIDDTISPEKPDAVFPNNWISTHHDGRVALYPMYSPMRRRERRQDVVDELRRFYRLTEVVDYSAAEEDGQHLEGTGSLVLDHQNKLAYVSLSKRAHPKALERFCSDFGYEAITFTSIGEDGQPVYHTNVIMCMGTEFALIALEMIPDKTERERVRSRLEASGKRIFPLTRQQIANFAGNAIELHNDSEKLLVLSARALPHFSKSGRDALGRFARLLPLELPTIELAGGSARCMIATIHLPPRDNG